jgi:hypothetical protein
MAQSGLVNPPRAEFPRRTQKVAIKNKGVSCVSKKKHGKRLHFSPNRPKCLSNELTELGLSGTTSVPSIAPTVVSARSTLKVEGKDSQLPVTDLAPEVQVPAI